MRLTTRTRAAFTLIELVIVMAIIALLAVIIAPNIIESRKFAHQGAAVGALRQIHTGQTLFREADREGDNEFDYATSLIELRDANAIDEVLARGTKLGYTFQTGAATATADFLWFAVANPILGTVTGDMYFATNHQGQIYYTFEAAVALNTTNAQIPSNMKPLNSQ